MTPALRALRWPRTWLCAWLVFVAAVVVVSLLPARDLPPMPFDGVDKLEHLLAYAAMATGAVMIFASRRAHAGVALALVALGIALEFAQGAMTASRMADGADAVANALGVALGWGLGRTPVARGLLVVEAWLAEGPGGTGRRAS
ncbi:VanZ family protein [Marilutibacter aestuarii]|uniref:VanZ family protein n=1 Tax=Marilutibacter aestuarii TaxID=1706195 RepID=A0A508ACZ5_9GAMM|nr:VanZ family protein [Lysobacter aestuarii]TQD47729.1 VanZ family protein [Lysobacter aestuarii]